MQSCLVIKFRIFSNVSCLFNLSCLFTYIDTLRYGLLLCQVVMHKNLEYLMMSAVCHLEVWHYTQFYWAPQVTKRISLLFKSILTHPCLATMYDRRPLNSTKCDNRCSMRTHSTLQPVIDKRCFAAGQKITIDFVRFDINHSTQWLEQSAFMSTCSCI